jgi:hypothetical protein
MVDMVLSVQTIFFLVPLVFWQSLDEDPKVSRIVSPVLTAHYKYRG